MAGREEQILRAAKEVVVKFIEGGRISPATFQDTFKMVYQTIRQTVEEAPQNNEPQS